MPTSQVSHLGNLRTQALHTASGTKISTDAPVDNHGKGELFSPTDLLATSLAACMITLMGIKSNDNGFELKQIESDVHKKMGTNPRRVRKIQIDFRFPESRYSEIEKTILKKAALECPVAMSLNQEITQEITFKFE